MNLFRIRAPLVIAAASVLALSACEGSSTGPGPAAEGTVVFSYTGAEAGSYSATGRFDRLRPDQGTFAVGALGELQTGQDALVVYAHSVRDDELADEFLLSIGNPQVGEFSCGADETGCAFGALFFVGADAEGNSEGIYTSVAGTLTVTSINEDRARGTFTFQLETLDFSETPETVQVTSGTFDVPLIDAVN